MGLAAEMECLQVFAKITEEARRERSLRMDLGDEKARLKISWQSNNQNNQNNQRHGQGNKNWSDNQSNWRQGGQQDWRKDQGGHQGGKNQGGKGGKRSWNQNDGAKTAKWQKW